MVRNVVFVLYNVVVVIVLGWRTYRYGVCFCSCNSFARTLADSARRESNKSTFSSKFQRLIETGFHFLKCYKLMVVFPIYNTGMRTNSYILLIARLAMYADYLVENSLCGWTLSISSYIDKEFITTRCLTKKNFFFSQIQNFYDVFPVFLLIIYLSV